MRNGAELSGKKGERGKKEKQRGDFIKARQGQQEKKEAFFYSLVGFSLADS